ncbi:hypothetical protein BDZ94DRAFT_1321498 [Collybia nuda]|uniref:F-box domain-containing protein n=1 Tax=Collybia nuda TaxID=64659 RepID=A0A9P5YA55_9AGAR|nr:hypothetical protein BDZ94DRAFT_1321498 [Collybia nuda]
MEPTFSAQLHTNYVPPRSEVTQIRNIVLGSLEERARLDEKIARFQAIVDDLRGQHHKLGIYTEDHLALTSGARRLPHDIIQVIFCHCLPTDRNAVMSAKEPPLLLGRICSGWRRIALSTPDLWTTLHVSIPNCQVSSHYIKWRRVAEAVKSWLNLSGGLPLSISAACSALVGGQPDRETSLNITYLMNLFIRHSRRWENIDFILPIPEFIAIMASLTEADVPLLKSATLESTVFNPTNLWPSVSILNAPTLREVSIISFKHTDFLQPLPWAQLTGLHLEDSTHMWSDTPSLNELDAINILKQCSLLVTCKLLVESDPSSLPPQPTLHEVILPFLRLFILIEGRRTLRSQFIECLTLPLLEYLGFRSYFAHHIDHPPFPLTIFFTRENKIEELELEIGATSTDTWTECLSHASSIKRLTLIAPEQLWAYPPFPALNDHFLSLLTPLSSNDLLCPSLEEINLKFCEGVTDEKILLFLRERTNPTHMANGMVVLKRATFTVNREMITDIMSDVQQLIAAGLELDLKYTPPLSLGFTEETEDVDVPGGPHLRAHYFSRLPDEIFSPLLGLRINRAINTLS